MHDSNNREAGCIFEGHRGHYIYDAIIQFALDEGWAAVVDVDWTDEAKVDIAEQAESWLNENIADHAWAYGWHYGEFFYMPMSWWNSEEYE